MRAAEAPRGGPISLRAIGAVDPAILDALRTPLAERFHRAVAIGSPIALSSQWYDPRRGQYQADLILDDLVARHEGGGWTLGIVDRDLFAPGLSFIFGQATVSGCCAVIGLARLCPAFYGDPPDHALFLRRVLTEAVHELGHVAGLDHCPRPECVMHFSATLEDTDRKGTEFCPRCRR